MCYLHTASCHALIKPFKFLSYHTSAHPSLESHYFPSLFVLLFHEVLYFLMLPFLCRWTTVWHCSSDQKIFHLFEFFIYFIIFSLYSQLFRSLKGPVICRQILVDYLLKSKSCSEQIWVNCWWSTWLFYSLRYVKQYLMSVQHTAYYTPLSIPSAGLFYFNFGCAQYPWRLSFFSLSVRLVPWWHQGTTI